MASLERFFNPQMRPFGLNMQALPGAKLYFFDANSTTPSQVYQDKQGAIAHPNPVVADANGNFPQIFLAQRLYRVSLTDRKNLVQPGWPIDNVGQDTIVVPFGPWNEQETYEQAEIVTGSDGNWYSSVGGNNLGNDPIDGDGFWELIPKPVASSFTSDSPDFSFSDVDGQISLDVDQEESTITLGGVFAGTNQLRISRIGDRVSLSISSFIHPPASTASSAAGVIPAQYRPATTMSWLSLGFGSGGALGFALIQISPAGTLTINYYNSSLAPISTLDSVYGIGFSYHN